MTATMILSCILWTNTTLTVITQQPVNDGMAVINQTVGDFKFYADVIEEKMNYVEITHLNSGAMASAYTLEWPQRTLVTRLQLGNQQSSLDCEIKY